MKHLKLFENYNYYKQITSEEFWGFENLISIEKKYIDQLEKNGFKSNYFLPASKDSAITYVTKDFTINGKFTGDIYSINIFQWEDDYFLVKLGYKQKPNEYFKCDQFEGLLKLLKDGNL